MVLKNDFEIQYFSNTAWEPCSTSKIWSNTAAVFLFEKMTTVPEQSTTTMLPYTT